MLDLLRVAAKTALPSHKGDVRQFWLGCVAVRKDGTLVKAKNGAAIIPSHTKYYGIPSSHAEGRVVRKIDKGAILYVARVRREDGCLAMARPCGMCRSIIKAKKIKKVYYTINDNQYGVFYVDKDIDRVYHC